MRIDALRGTTRNATLARTCLASLALLAAGCGFMLNAADFPPKGSFVPLNPPPRPLSPRPIESVMIFSGVAPSAPFVEVGLVEAHTTATHDQDMENLMATLRWTAARSGCDALYNLVPHDRPFSGTMGFRGYQATCIVYREAPAGVVVASAAASAPAASPVVPPVAPTPSAPQSSAVDAGAVAADPSAACKAAADYDARASAATSPVKEQLAKLAASKHKECDAASSGHP